MATPPKGHVEQIGVESAHTEDQYEDSLPDTPEIEPGKIPDTALPPPNEEPPQQETPEG